MRVEVLLGIHGVWDVVDPGLVDAKKDNIEAIKTRNLGADRVKEASLQTLITEFENLKMSYNGTIDEYAAKLSGITSKSAMLGEVMSEHRKEVSVRSECRKLLEYVTTIAWNIWKSRNRLVFENTQPYPDQVISTSNIIVHEADSTLSHFSASNPLVMYDLSQESSRKWVPPTLNIVKLNCDGAFKWNKGVVGIAAQDCEGSLLLCLRERWHTSSVLATELIALRTACSVAMTKGWKTGAQTGCAAYFLVFRKTGAQIGCVINPIENVANEVVHKELGDSLVRAAATASSLESEQDSGGGPRCQETMGDTIAQTRFENVSKHSNDLLLARGEDASKQGRINDIYADEEITLVSVQNMDEEMFDVNVLDGEEVFVAEQKVDANKKDDDGEITLAQALIKMKSTKPKVKGVVIQDPGKEKRAGTELIQENTKKQKVEDDKETAKLKQLIKIIPDEEEVAIEAIPLAIKSPKDAVWRNQQGYKVLDWKLYDSCGVHSLRMQHMHIYMLEEKKYPLAPLTLSMMLEKKLNIDYESEMAYQLLKSIIKQLKK
ncbi:hypothetical protein Tco_0489800 [Tanacetum coccineum]